MAKTSAQLSPSREAALFAELLDVARQKGVTRFHVDHGKISIDAELGPAPPSPRGPPDKLTPEQQAQAKQQARIAALTRQLGRVPTDEELKSLP